MYNFLFDKRSLVLLLAGMGIAGGVLFFAGVLVGVQWSFPIEAAPAAAPARPMPRRAALRAAERPCKPAPEAAPAAPQPVPLPALFPRAEQKRAAVAPAPEPVTVEPAPPAPVPAPAPAAAAVAVTPAPDPEPKASPEPATGPGRYSLQVGAFRDARNSEKVIQDLQARGYEPYVVEQKGRSVLRTVRIGRYADRTEALRAASELRRREGLEAIVRPLGS
ncbi:MAG: SPOR domain-containing protein [Thermoanaerobaculia bacterium]